MNTLYAHDLLSRAINERESKVKLSSVEGSMFGSDAVAIFKSKGEKQAIPFSLEELTNENDAERIVIEAEKLLLGKVKA